MTFNDGTPITNDEFAKRVDDMKNGKEVHPVIKAAVDSIPEPIVIPAMSYDAGILNIVGLSKEEQDKVNYAYSNISTSSTTSSIFHKQEMELKERLKSMTAVAALTILNNDAKRKDYFLNRIVCAANRATGSPTILGPRHWDDTMRRQYDMLDENLRLGAGVQGLPPQHEYEEGFLDKHGDFKTRQEAWHIALAAGQIIRLCGGNESKGGTLYSENLY